MAVLLFDHLYSSLLIIAFPNVSPIGALPKLHLKLLSLI